MPTRQGLPPFHETILIIVYAPDVIDVAVHCGSHPADKDPKDFLFSDMYDPVAFTHAEARVWSMFSSIVDNDGSFQLEYQDYASGHDVSNRMPLFVKPCKKLCETLQKTVGLGCHGAHEFSL
jgi:hypothetical protein